MARDFYPYGGANPPEEKEESTIPDISVDDFRTYVEKSGKKWKGTDHAFEWNKKALEDGTAKFRLIPGEKVLSANQMEKSEDPRTARSLPVNEPNVPKANLSESPFGQFFVGLSEGGGGSMIPGAPVSAPPVGIGAEVGRAIGAGAGMLMPFNVLGKASAAAKFPHAAQSALTLGAYSGLQANQTPEERAKSAFEGAAFGGALAGAAGLKGPIGAAFRNPVSGTLLDTGIIAGTGIVQGQDIPHALLGAATIAIPGRATGVMGGPDGMTLKDYIKEVPTGRVKIATPEKAAMDARKRYQDILEGLVEAAPEVKMDEFNAKLEKGKNVDGYLEDVAQPGAWNALPEVKKQIRQEVKQLAKDHKETTGKAMPGDQIKQLIRIRELESMLPKEVVESVNAGDIKNKGWGNLTDWRRGLQGAGGRGIVGLDKNALDTYVLRVNERAQLVPDIVAVDVFKRLAQPVEKLSDTDRKLFGEYMAAKSRANDLANGKDAAPETAAEIAALEKSASERLNAVSDKAAFSVAERETRAAYEYLWEKRNAARQAISGKELGQRGEYYPVTRNKPTLVERGKRMAEERNLMPATEDRVKSDYFSPHAARRTGKTAIEDMVTDPIEVAKDYAKDFARATVYEGAIKHNLNYAEYFRLKGLDKLAKSLEDYTATAYSGKATGADLLFQRVFNGSAPGRVLMSSIEGMGQAFRGATFTLNTGWSLTTQGTSAALPAGRYPEFAAPAFMTYTQPSFRRIVDQLYSMQMKSRKFGRVSDIARHGDVLEGTRLGKRTKRDIADDTLGALSSFIEAETGYFTAAVAYYRGRSIGLEGKNLANYMSDQIAKYQSMYDKFNRPNLMNSKLVAGYIPMQSFHIEMMNMAREMLGISGIGVKEPGNNWETLARLGGMIAATIISDEVTKTIGNKDNYNLATPIPFASMFIPSKQDGELPGPLSGFQSDFANRNLTLDTFRNMNRGWDEIGSGRWETGVGRMARPFVPGGAQINATLQTIGAARGAHAVNIEEDEIWRSLLFGGPYATESGKEHLEMIEGKYRSGSKSGSSRTGSTRGGQRR